MSLNDCSLTALLVSLMMEKKKISKTLNCQERIAEAARQHGALLCSKMLEQDKLILLSHLQAISINDAYT